MGPGCYHGSYKMVVLMQVYAIQALSLLLFSRLVLPVLARTNWERPRCSPLENWV